MTRFVGALLEAWSEVKVHRARFALSAVGVFLAVFTMTLVQAFGAAGISLVEAEAEQYQGRPGTVTIRPDSGSGLVSATAPEEIAALRGYSEQLQASHSSVEATADVYTLTFERTSSHVTLMLVDEAYAAIHRQAVSSGRWLRSTDVDQASLQVVVSSSVADELGIPTPLTRPWAVTLPQGGGQVATVVGIVPSGFYDRKVYALADQGLALGLPISTTGVSMKIWMTPEAEVQLYGDDYYQQSTVALPGGLNGWVETTYTEDIEFLSTLVPWIVRVLGLFALGLASLGVINVGVVTVRSRVREIGVRRSFGAPTNQVFTAIMLESVLASIVAGGLGILAAVAVYRTPWEAALRYAVNDMPPFDVPSFPLSVATESLLIASAVGALAGIIPAVMAVRAKVIEAIRF